MKKVTFVISLVILFLLLSNTSAVSIENTEKNELDIEIIGGDKLTIIITNNGDDTVHYKLEIRMRGLIILISDWCVSNIAPGDMVTINRWIPKTLMIVRGKITTGDNDVFRFGGIDVFGHLFILYGR